MSNEITSASAPGLPSRRLFLAAGSVTAVFGALRRIVSAGNSELKDVGLADEAAEASVMRLSHELRAALAERYPGTASQFKDFPVMGSAPRTLLFTAGVGAPEPSAPTDRELTRYYIFLWGELYALSKEMGVEMHDSWTAHRNGDQKALKAKLLAPPSTRARAVLRAIGA